MRCRHCSTKMSLDTNLSQPDGDSFWVANCKCYDVGENK